MLFLLLKIKDSYQRPGESRGDQRVRKERRTFRPRMLEHLSWKGRDPREHGVPEQLDVPSYASAHLEGRLVIIEWHKTPWLTMNIWWEVREGRAPSVTSLWPNPFAFHMWKPGGRKAEWLASGHTLSWQQNLADVLTLRRTFHSPPPRLSKLRPAATPVCVWPASLRWTLHF